MDALIGAVIGILLSAIVSGAIIWIIGKLNLGLHVDNFGWLFYQSHREASAGY